MILHPAKIKTTLPNIALIKIGNEAFLYFSIIGQTTKKKSDV